MKPSLSEFINENKLFIDSVIRNKVPNAAIDEEERRSWVLNCEELYAWASQYVSDEEEGF
tara:strand:- start:838 stop:1017 length:180 start_codon:yes stop_codon:yes gene_type:complete